MSPLVQPSRVRPGDRLLASGVFLVLLALFSATFTGVPENPDAEVEFQTSSSLARRGRWDVGGTPEAAALVQAEVASGATGFGVAPGGPGRGDRSYSWFGVGQALTGVPFWWIGTGLARLFPGVEARHGAEPSDGWRRSEYFAHLACGWRNALWTALTAWLVVLSARRLGATGQSAFLAGLSYGVATFAWPQARSTLSDVQATLGLFAGFHLLVLARERWERLRRLPLVPLALAGLALGWAVLTRIAVLPAAAFLAASACLALVVKARRARRALRGWPVAPLVAFGLPLLACAGLFLALNRLRFGDPFETGYGAGMDPRTFFAGSPLVGLAGLLVAPGKGLAWMAPGAFLAPLGALRARGRDAAFLPWCVAGLALAVLLPVAFMDGWHGAWTYGPRYALPLLPFLWLLVALALDHVRDWPVGRVGARIVLWGGLLTSLPGVLVDYTTHLDLAEQAAPFAFDSAGETPFERSNDRFNRMQWRPGFAAPWAHWRILRHRVAGLGEDFPASAVFLLDDPVRLTPSVERRRGQRHFAWVDLQERLGGEVWPALVACLGLFALGLGRISRGLDDLGP